MRQFGEETRQYQLREIMHPELPRATYDLDEEIIHVRDLWEDEAASAIDVLQAGYTHAYADAGLALPPEVEKYSELIAANLPARLSASIEQRKAGNEHAPLYLGAFVVGELVGVTKAGLTLVGDERQFQPDTVINKAAYRMRRAFGSSAVKESFTLFDTAISQGVHQSGTQWPDMNIGHALTYGALRGVDDSWKVRTAEFVAANHAHDARLIDMYRKNGMDFTGRGDDMGSGGRIALKELEGTISDVRRSLISMIEWRRAY